MRGLLLSAFLSRFLVFTLLAAFIGMNAYFVRANPGNPDGSFGPQVPQSPVRAPEDLTGERPQEFGQHAPALANLPPLKAVVFVGPIDGENGEWTLSEIKNAQDTAAVLRSFGVTVYEYYPNQPDGTWENIKNAANGAHFIIYRGHGVYYSPMPYPNVGGFALKDTFVTPDMIRTQLKPANNFVVMLYGCFTAGSAGNDTISISQEEARRRVEMYSDPFFDIGAGGYYADWYGDAFSHYSRALLEGKTQRQAYEGFYDYDSSRVWRGNHQNHPTMDLWLGWDNFYPPEPNWDNAFAGFPEKTLAELFQPTAAMVLSNNQVFYLADTDSPVRSYPITVGSTTSESFDWVVSVDTPPAWLVSITPASGWSGESFTLEIDPSKKTITDPSIITVHVITNKAGIIQPAQDIQVELKVVSNLVSMYLPSVTK